MWAFALRPWFYYLPCSRTPCIPDLPYSSFVPYFSVPAAVVVRAVVLVPAGASRTCRQFPLPAASLVWENAIGHRAGEGASGW